MDHIFPQKLFIKQNKKNFFECVLVITSVVWCLDVQVFLRTVF